MQCVARRIVDRNVLHLIKMWLTVPAEEQGKNGKRRLTGGKDHHGGTPQGGVVSPMLANLYMNRLLKGWRNTKRGEQFQARVVSYADDFVILSRGKAAQALDWTRSVVTRLGLTLNEAKTSIKPARQQSFDFLGYTFGPHCYAPNGRWYLGASPSKKSVARIKQKVGDLLVPNNVEVWSEVRDRLNQIVRGWAAYFSYGTTSAAYRSVDYYVYESVRHYLRRRHQVHSRGTTQFSRDAVYGRLGVVQLRRVRMESRS
jgi:RNA-directed DNA polymerase